MPSVARISVILLDLDGTLVDTAPDLVTVLNRVLREDGRAPLPYALARNAVSQGAAGLLRRAYGDDLPDATLATLRARFLEIYTETLCVHSRIFRGLENITESVSTNGVRWGIVTNKPRRLTLALLEALAIADRPGCVVSGGDLAVSKPHPGPLELAAARLGVGTAECVYVGDAPGDIEAGRAAGMRTIAAAYGYIRPGEPIAAWGPSAVVGRPRDVLGAVTELDR